MASCVIDIETMSLVPTDGRIVCIGAMNTDTAKFRAFYNKDEKTMVSNFLKYYKKSGFSEIIGFNVLFDIRYIFAKCLKYELPAREFLMSTYTDVMMILKSVRKIYNFNKPGTLNEWASFLFGEVKTLKSALMPLYYQQGEIEKIIEYNRNDVELTYRIWKKIKQVFENSIKPEGMVATPLPEES